MSVDIRDYHKMSKSRNNSIMLNDPPREMFSKLMAVPDDLVSHFIELLIWPQNTKESQEIAYMWEHRE